MVYTNAKDLLRSDFPRARFKGSSLPRYAGGGWLETAGTYLSSEQGQNMIGGAGMVGNFLGAVDAVDGKTNPYLSGAAGALKGAQMGAKFGPLGAGIGAAAGVGLALYKSHQEKQQAEELAAQKLREEQDRKNRLEAANYESSKAILSTYPTSGVADAGFMMAYGGMIKKFEDGGVVQPKGDPYEYKKEGDKFYTRKKGNSKWILTSGKSEAAIKEKVFKIAPQAAEAAPAAAPIQDYGTPVDPRLGGAQSDATAIQGPPVRNIGPGAPPQPGAFNMNLLAGNNLPSPNQMNLSAQASATTGPSPAAPTAPVMDFDPYSLDPRLNNSNPSDATYVAPVQQDTRDYVPTEFAPNQYDASRQQVENQMNSQAVQDALQTVDLPVKSDFSTALGRQVLKTVGVPLPGQQLISSTITRDSKFGFDDAPEGVKNHLISSIIKARKRSGKNKGGTEYIDYGKSIYNDLQTLDVETADAALGSYIADDFKAATTFGRVSYEYDPKTDTYKVYDNYDFSTLKDKKEGEEDDTYTKLRRGASKFGINDEGQGANLIGTFKGSDYKDLKVEDEYGKAKETIKNLKGKKDNLLAALGFKAYGGPTDPPKFDMSLLAGNSLPAPSQMPTSEPNVLTGYNDAQLAANRQKGNAVAIQNRADIVGDNLNTAYQYVKENPLDATQIALGSVAIGADGIPVIGNTVSAVADGINAGISGGRAAYYANKGDYGNAAFYSTAAALDGAAAIPGLGNAAGASKIGMLLNKTAHLAHEPIHMAHQLAPGVTAYKAANMGSGMVNQMAVGGKIPTQSADYLAEGGEVIQHAINDRPNTDQNGNALQLNSNTSKFVGDSHDAPSQGIGVANDQEARIYSKRLYAPKDLVAKLKKL